MEENLKTALRVGWASVVANRVPMVCLWLLAAALVWGYDSVWGVADIIGLLMRWQLESGWIAAFLNRVIFCGLLPGAFLVAVPSLRPRRLVATVVAYCLWAGFWGIACDAFFTLQQNLFGAGTDAWTLIQKTLVDQLVWNVFLCTPANALFFPWVAGGFVRVPFPGWRDFFFGRCLPILFSNWMVWIPVTAVMYVFPLPLQIQLVGLAGAFWMLVALSTGARSGRNGVGR